MDSELRLNPGLPPRVLQFIQPQASGDLGAQGTCGRLCPDDLQSPHCGPCWSGPGLEEAVTLSLPLPPHSIGIACSLLDLASTTWLPEESEGLLGWEPVSLRGDRWQGLGTWP